MSFANSAPHSITERQVMAVMAATERRHRVVWTAGRVLKADGSLHQVMISDPGRRRQYLSRLRTILRSLAERGILFERGAQFNYGMMREISYDFVGTSVAGNISDTLPPASQGCTDSIVTPVRDLRGP